MRMLLGLVVVAAAIVVWLLVGGAPPVEGVGAGEGRQVAPVAAQREAGRWDGVDADARAQRLREQAAQRAVMHARISEAMAERAAARRAAPGADEEVAADKQRARRVGAEAEAEAVPSANAMIDRTGNHAYLARVLSQDLSPLADECYELARQRKPELAGLLVLDVEILGDEEIGGVVDAAAPAPNNELDDAELIECVRESLLATTLPPPEQGGRDAVALSLRFTPDAEK